nr:MAG TPA: hypothetical protein [Caudoviricetes sp.]
MLSIRFLLSSGGRRRARAHALSLLHSSFLILG